MIYLKGKPKAKRRTKAEMEAVRTAAAKEAEAVKKPRAKKAAKAKKK